MGERRRIPGTRDVRATVDRPAENGDPDGCVVACPPHPRHGGRRTDGRLRAVSDAITARGLACLRFDYGPWDGGWGEQSDARDALDWARAEYGRAGLFGYSFGGAVALFAVAELSDEEAPAAVSVLAPADTLGGESTADVVNDIDCPVQVIVGERDGTVDGDPIAERARESGHAVESLPADHFFTGQEDRMGRLVGSFLASER